MRKKSVFFFVSIFLMATVLLSGCGKKTSKPMPDMSGMGNVNVIVREDGSGTRVEFETLSGSSETGTDQIAASTQEVLNLVAERKNAIGYAAYSAIPKNAPVKILSVSGVALNEQSIQSEKYPLCRNYYLAYLGESNDLGKDFLKYILSAGQKTVKEYCIPVQKTATFLSDKSEGTLTIQGSSSVAPLMKALIENYRTYNSKATINLTISDSSAGLNATIQRKCDIAMSSRRLKDYEKNLLTTKTIASDAIVIVVNPANPLTDITPEQLRAIYDGKTARWSDMK